MLLNTIPQEEKATIATDRPIGLPRRSRRAVIAALSVLAVAGAGTICGVAWWKQTVRREMTLPQLEAATRKTPNDGPLLALYAARLAETHDLPDAQQATAVLTKAIAAGESTDAVWQTVAALYAFQGDERRAVDTIRSGQKTLGSNALAQAVTRANQVPEGGDPMALATALCPDGPDALTGIYAAGSPLNGLAEWWGRNHPEQSGFATREQWAKDEPGNAEALRLWGEALLANRRPQEALQVLDQASKLAQNRSSAAHIAHARALDGVGQAANAVTELMLVLHDSPQSVPALVALGDASLHAGMDLSRPAFLRATQLAPDSADAWIGLGRTDLSDGDSLTEALQALEHAAQLAPLREDYQVNYADALNRNGRGPEAENVLRQFLNRNPYDARAHRALGNVLQENDPTPDRLAEAEKETKAALEDSPVPHFRALAELQLGQILLSQRKAPEAVTALRQAMTDDPSEPKAQRLLARAYLQSGQSAQAIQFTERAKTTATIRQRVDLLIHRASTRFLDPAFHRELRDLYQQSGKQDSVVQEEYILSRLESDPKGTAARARAFQDESEKLVGIRPSWPLI